MCVGSSLKGYLCTEIDRSIERERERERKREREREREREEGGREEGGRGGGREGGRGGRGGREREIEKKKYFYCWTTVSPMCIHVLPSCQSLYRKR